MHKHPDKYVSGCRRLYHRDKTSQRLTGTLQSVFLTPRPPISVAVSLFVLKQKGKHMNRKTLTATIAICILTLPAFAAPGTDGLCTLIAEMQEIFKLLRTLAFVGAGFILAKYAWEAISTGKLNGETELIKGAQKTGIPMLVGLILLFAIGTILQVLSSASGANIIGCSTELFHGW